MKLALDHLPGSLRVIAELIGLPATLRLVEEFGGIALSLSQGKTAAGQAGFARLAEVIGEENARALAKHYKRERLPVARCVAAVRAARDAQLRADYDHLTRALCWGDGEARAHLARHNHMTDRHVSRLLTRPDHGGEVVETRQGELF